MREIKFRGKNLNTKEWVYGDLLQWNDGETAIGVHGNSLMTVIILMKTMIKHLMLMKLP